MNRQMLLLKVKVVQSAVRRWMVVGPEVSRLATVYEIVSEAKDANEKVTHHEQTARAQLQFFEKVESRIE